MKILVLAALLVLAGCSTSNVDIKNLGMVPQKIVDVLAGPIINFTIADAQSTVKWVDGEVAAGRMTEAIATQAKACPNAIIAINQFYDSIKMMESSQDGARGFIYYWTIQQYGGQGSVEQKGKALAMTVVAECGKLVPADRFGPGIGLIG